MTEINKRLLIFFDEALKDTGGTTKELCEQIGITQSNVSEIRIGKRGFTHEQALQLLRITNGSADYVYGFTKEKYRPNKIKTDMQLFNQAVNQLRGLIK